MQIPLHKPIFSIKLQRLQIRLSRSYTPLPSVEIVRFARMNHKIKYFIQIRSTVHIPLFAQANN